MASGARLSKDGTVTGTGADIAILLPFPLPNRVTLWNRTSGDQLDWSLTMGNATGFKRLANGTGSFITSLGITPSASGFTIGADTDLNVSGEVLSWFAEE